MQPEDPGSGHNAAMTDSNVNHSNDNAPYYYITGEVVRNKVVSQSAGRKRTQLKFECAWDPSLFYNSVLSFLVGELAVYSVDLDANSFARVGSSLVCTVLSPYKSDVNKLAPDQRENIMVTVQLQAQTIDSYGRVCTLMVEAKAVPFITEKTGKRPSSASEDMEHRDAHACKKAKLQHNVIMDEVPPYDFRVTVRTKTGTTIHSFCNHTSPHISLPKVNLKFRKHWVDVVPVADEMLTVKLESKTVCLVHGAVHGLYNKEITVENRNNVLFATIQGKEYRCQDNRLQLARLSEQLQGVFTNEEKLRISNEPTHFEATGNGLLMITTAKQALKVRTSVASPISFTVANIDRFSANVFECEGCTVTIQRQNTAPNE